MLLDMHYLPGTIVFCLIFATYVVPTTITSICMVSKQRPREAMIMQQEVARLEGSRLMSHSKPIIINPLYSFMTTH